MSVAPRFFPALILILALAASAARAGSAPLGFPDAEGEAQLRREGEIAASFSTDSLRRHMRILTERPHVAGTAADRANAEYVRGP